MSTHDGLETVVGIRGLVGKRLAAAFYALKSKPSRRSLLLPSERDGEFLSSVFYTSAAKCVFIRRLARPRHITDRSVSTMTLA